MKVLSRYALLFFIFLVVPAAQAATEIKVSCGPADKALAQTWIGLVSDAKVKVENKNASDAVDQFLDKGSDLTLIEPALRNSQVRKVEKRNLLYLPVALSAQVVITNLPGIRAGELKLSPKVLSDIFLGVIKNWSDPAIKKLNPGLLLPDLDIFVVHLSNQNSKNDPFPAFLLSEDAQWNLKREKDKNIHWTVGENVGDNLKTLEKVRDWAGSVAVVDMAFAEAKHLQGARIENAAGQFTPPTADSLEAALSAKALDQPAFLTKTVGKKAYPLTWVIWAVVDGNYGTDYRQPKKGQALQALLKAVLSEEGQKKAADLFGAALPANWIEAASKKAGQVQY